MVRVPPSFEVYSPGHNRIPPSESTVAAVVSLLYLPLHIEVTKAILEIGRAHITMEVPRRFQLPDLELRRRERAIHMLYYVLAMIPMCSFV